MKTYVRVQDGIVQEIIEPMIWDQDMPDWQEGDESRIGKEIPIEERYTPWFVAQLVDVTDLEIQPVYGWTYDGVTFAAPVPYQPTPAEIFTQNRAQQVYLASQASQSATLIFMAIQFGAATDEQSVKARAWQAYYLALESVDLTAPNPVWPVLPA